MSKKLIFTDVPHTQYIQLLVELCNPGYSSLPLLRVKLGHSDRLCL